MKKTLVMFKNGSDLDLILDSYKNLNHLYGFKIVPIYIKNIAYTIPIRETIINSGIASKMLHEIEDKFIDTIRDKLLQYNIHEKLIIETEISGHSVKNHLKYCDLLLLDQDFILNDLFLDILKNLYRPVIILRNKPLNFLSIALISNDGVKVNKSAYNFISLFSDINKINMFTWNYNDDSNYLKDLLIDKGLEISVKRFFSDTNDISGVYSILNNYNLVIMGNLSRSFFFEKITNRMGLNFLENINTSIFIG